MLSCSLSCSLSSSLSIVLLSLPCFLRTRITCCDAMFVVMKEANIEVWLQVQSMIWLACEVEIERDVWPTLGALCARPIRIAADKYVRHSLEAQNTVMYPVMAACMQERAGLVKGS